ncbi:hypothetical protein SPRG_07628 [Saprolegnia parasitica CBS 223.65]|uniref:F-box domain-containing protein n=1 Tax=Saprolegnia parasitica (strain CBS 223.65) TaxID=695850 RepID=A0A067C813_SAPPC|nr:hypothetical protein SPRG_07628 [Saprolegnia parasitica CBS 223.65]KDO26914.1 hypothetical protein SPRG_07628 [Saprolegnia parasitica CBS 223.65]|eukprot:XP_012202296.1 hypothetical protein SPRG_07628 [Saprolegnia parasitica CBS 223.65]
MATKRIHTVPTPALALNHLRVAVVQCLDSYHDVVAFLRALPSLSAPLAALLALLQGSSRAMDQWPAIALERLSESEVELALIALPAIPAIHVHNRDDFDDNLWARVAGLCTLAATWPTKITHLSECIQDNEIPYVQRIVSHCTRLDAIVLHLDAFAPLLPSLPRGLRHVALMAKLYVPPPIQNIAPTLRQWVEVGTSSKKHISFHNTWVLSDAEAVANVLATAPSLTGLDIDDTSELVEEAKQLLARLDVAKLTRLEVDDVADVRWVLSLLHSMPNLQDLSLNCGEFKTIPATLAAATPRLRKLQVRNIGFSATAFNKFLGWA